MKARYFYHGTLVENLDTIRQHGLVLRPLVWLATDATFAAVWAERRAGYFAEDGQRHRKPFTVLRVRLPVDVEVCADPNLPDERSCTVKRAIPPEDIDVLVGDPWAERRRWKKL